MLATLIALLAVSPESIWLEAEWFGPLEGSNFSILPESTQTRGSWALAGPDAAPAWTQGGESEFMSIAARADEPAGVSVERRIEVPIAGQYTLWVRYADYRAKREEFVIAVSQEGSSRRIVFGEKPVVDEMDQHKLMWDWAFGWASAKVDLKEGPADVRIETTGPTGARRHVDCLCFTTDPTYHPNGREKPDCPAWAVLRSKPAVVESLLTQELRPTREPPKPAFLWNVGAQWLDELTNPGHIESPYAVDPPLLADFRAAFAGKNPPIYSDPLSGPVVHIPLYPSAFSAGSSFLAWLDGHPDARFAILLNYGEPNWPKDADRKAVHQNLLRYANRFAGFIAGENIAYAAVDEKAVEKKVKEAKTRQDVLDVLQVENAKATFAKFRDVFGEDDANPWSEVVSCLSANAETYVHSLCDWGTKRIGHENTGNSPSLARRLAFLRGAARQFGARIVDYQSCNLGDSASMFSRESYFYPGSSRYVLDNQYDVWAGAGMNWLYKDYVLWWLAGADAFYNEQGVDLFWKPGGGVAGDGFPVQLSPKGKVAEAAIRLAREHPRGEQYAPIAFLLDQAHGWSQERMQPGGFGLDPKLNPAVLAPGPHEASIRGWFDIAYFPAPETQNEPSSGVRQTYVNGIFGDIFDVIVTAKGRTDVLSNYRAVVLAGEVPLNKEWERALDAYVAGGGTVVVCAGQSGGQFGIAGKSLGLASEFRWEMTGAAVSSNRFRFVVLKGGTPLATVDGQQVASLEKRGKGQIIRVGVPLGLGIDERPVPILSLLMRHLAAGIVPIHVDGDVEWTLNHLADGGWLVAILNNRGVFKPQHGMLQTDHRESVAATIRPAFRISRCEEWTTGDAPVPSGGAVALTVPAGGVRLVALYEK